MVGDFTVGWGATAAAVVTCSSSPRWVRGLPPGLAATGFVLLWPGAWWVWLWLRRNLVAAAALFAAFLPIVEIAVRASRSERPGAVLLGRRPVYRTSVREVWLTNGIEASDGA